MPYLTRTQSQPQDPSSAQKQNPDQKQDQKQ